MLLSCSVLALVSIDMAAGISGFPPVPAASASFTNTPQSAIQAAPVVIPDSEVQVG